MGDKDSALALLLVLPRKPLGLPLTVITPLALTAMEATYLELCVSQACGKTALTSA